MSKYTHPEYYEAGFSSDDSRMAFVKRMARAMLYRDNDKCLRASLSIINECVIDCGENVGGESSTNSPAQADSDDGDGDGDGDPDPERRRPGRPRNTRNNTFPAAAEHFDRLPDSAHIDIATLKAITGKSRATLYRWIDKGILPKPRKLGPTHNFWTAGDIRRALSA